MGARLQTKIRDLVRQGKLLRICQRCGTMVPPKDIAEVKFMSAAPRCIKCGSHVFRYAYPDPEALKEGRVVPGAPYLNPVKAYRGLVSRTVGELIVGPISLIAGLYVVFVQGQPITGSAGFGLVVGILLIVAGTFGAIRLRKLIKARREEIEHLPSIPL